MINLRLKNQVIPKAEEVVLRRLSDGVIFRISSSCILRLPCGLFHVVGQPQEELDHGYIWDVRQKFAVIEIRQLKSISHPKSPCGKAR
jgi:hypothetical protein